MSQYCGRRGEREEFKRRRRAERKKKRKGLRRVGLGERACMMLWLAGHFAGGVRRRVGPA